MDYKLALKLKEVGFPQGDTEQIYTKEGVWVCKEYDISGMFHISENNMRFRIESDISIPTLSELIEATKQKGRELSFDECNERWGSKYNHDKGIFERDENGKVIEELKSPYQWEAKLEDWNSKEYGKRRCYEAGDEVVTFTGGKTLEEAVANLYIKLNS